MKSKRLPKIQSSMSEDEQLIQKALRCLESKLKYQPNVSFLGSKQVRAYFQLQLAGEKNEVFSVLFMNNSHQLIAFEKMFHGTINEATVYPRCVVQKALELNASAIIVGHNHPSSNLMPSQADIDLTRDLKKILNIVNVKLLDHIVVTSTDTFSFY
jgi:DNA repair protein RadC